MKTFEVLVRWLPFEVDGVRDREPIKCTIRAAAMRTRKDNLEFVDEAGEIVAVFSYWEQAFEQTALVGKETAG